MARRSASTSARTRSSSLGALRGRGSQSPSHAYDAMVSTTTAKATITMLVKVVAAISALRRDAPSELQTRVQRVGVQQLGGRGLGAFGDAVREDVLRLAGRPGGRGR